MATDDGSGRREYEHRDPVPDTDPRYGEPRRCGHWGYRRSDGSLCLGWVIKGTKKCQRHSGKTRAAAVAEGQVVTVAADLKRWGLGTSEVDPGEVLLRLVSQSAARCDLYASLLEEAYDAAERLKAAAEAEELVLADPERRTAYRGDQVIDLPEHAAKQTARADLERIFSAGGVAALIGRQYSATKDGDIYATGEAIRGLAQLESQERDRCAAFATKAKAAGLAERSVEVAEQQVRLVGEALAAVFAEMGLAPEQAKEARRGLARHLRLTAG